MYRSGVKPWNSASWSPSEKRIHETTVEAKEVKGKEDDEVA